MVIFASCTGSDDSPSSEPEPPDLTGVPTIALTGASFSEGVDIPEQYTCVSQTATSPNLLWHDVPGEAKSLLVWVSDPDALNFVHWLVYNIPPSESGLTAGIGEEPILGDGARQGKNSFGHFGYGPPCPPPKQTHRYTFRVYALDATLDLGPGATPVDVLNAMRGHTIGYGKFSTRYSRPDIP